jgi:hypothetical protein
MPYKVTWIDRGAIQKYSGSLAFTDIENADNILFGDSRFDDINYIIIDCMDVDETQLRGEDASVLAYTDNVATTYKRRLKIAFVCQLQSLASQIGDYIKYLQNLGTTWDVGIFSDLKSAEDWAKG